MAQNTDPPICGFLTQGGRCDAHFCIFLCPLKCLDKSRGGPSVSNSLLTYFKGATSQKTK